MQAAIALLPEPSSGEDSKRSTMKAIVHVRYGRPDRLEFREVDKPVLDDDQVLLRVHAASVNPVEWYGVTGPYFARFGNGLRRPNHGGRHLARVWFSRRRIRRDRLPCWLHSCNESGRGCRGRAAMDLLRRCDDYRSRPLHFRRYVPAV